MEIEFGTFESNVVLNTQCKRRRIGVDGKDSNSLCDNVYYKIEDMLPCLKGEDYYTEPLLSELASRELINPGYMSRVRDFTVGRTGFGFVRFKGETDVRGLDLDRIVKFRRHEVCVYEDESEKPEVGEGLNKAAEVVLVLKIGALSSFGEDWLREMEGKLKERSESQGAKFASFDSVSGEWKFLVQHFSRFGLGDDDEDDIVMDDASPQEPHFVEMDGGDVLDIDEENALVELSVLPHSLPTHLGLDPVKMNQMKMLMFPDEEDGVEDMNDSPSLQRLPYNREASRSPLKQKSAHKPTPPLLSRKTPLACIEYKAGSFTSTAPGSILVAQQNKAIQLKAVKPEGFKLNINQQTPVSGSHSRNVVDAGLFMGRSFRVGWGPNGVLVHSGNPVGSSGYENVLSSVIKIEKVAIDRVVRDEENTTKDELVASCFDAPLTLHKELPHETEEVGMGPFKLKLQKLVCNTDMLSEICRNYIEIVERQLDVPGLAAVSRIQFMHQALIWELIKVLFSSIRMNRQIKPLEADTEEEIMPEDEESSLVTDPEALSLIRRAQFSLWLQESVCHRVQEEVSSLNESSDLEHVFLLLTGRQLDDAVELAASRGDVRLACLLSQAGGSPVSRSDISRQLDLWRLNGMDFNFIEKERVRVLELLSGNILGSLHDINIDWKRFLGLLMWYQLSPDTSLPTIFNTYQQLLVEGKAPYPVPVYIDEGPAEDALNWQAGDRFDLTYYLMILYAKQGNQFLDLKTMFTAFSSTNDPLDYHMIWHQRAVLEAVGTFTSNDLHLLDMGVISQLLCLGQCHWAIYIVLHMPYREDYPYLQANLIREILFQYCETWSTQGIQQQVIEELGIPSAWLQEALAVYYNYYGDFSMALEHYLQCSNWQKAHSIFITSTAPSLFMSGKHSEIWRVVTIMEDHRSEIENWDLGGGIYVSFFLLRSSLQEESNTMNELVTLKNKNDACRDLVIRLNESLGVLKSKLPVDARVVYSKMAEEIGNLLLSDSGEDSTAEIQLSCFDTVFQGPLPEDHRSCHLQDAVSLFTAYLSGQAA
ncbi:hypothetical protein Leryth_005176 [Lithospermum erythrorhizon]|nr:hypothetical protein Leryth_005176 [Lithospermum erythrorhizon]